MLKKQPISHASRAKGWQENPMNEHKNYRWPDLSPVVRQYVVKDDQGRVGIAYQDREDVMFAHPATMPSMVTPGTIQGTNHLPVDAIIMTNTAWHWDDAAGAYTGWWWDDDVPTSPASVPPEMIRRLEIVEDLGFQMPDRWADEVLAGSDEMGYWNHGAHIGKVGGKPPKNGQASNEMTVAQAEDYAREVGESVTARAIRLAARNGYIPGARKVGRDWLIPYEGINYYLDNRPKPGRK